MYLARTLTSLRETGRVERRRQGEHGHLADYWIHVVLLHSY